LIDRNNDEWIAALSSPGPQRDAALVDLRALLVRGLGYAMARHRNVSGADIEDFAQDALLKILDGLKSFRGESRFTTWAHKVAVHVAFTELRRRRWRDVSLDEATSLPEGSLLPQKWIDPSAKTEQQAMQREILNAMRHVIANELTDKQRQAFITVHIRGMPMAELAEKMNTNRNALYKLLFDARKKLKKQMMAKGLSAQDVLAAFGS